MLLLFVFLRAKFQWELKPGGLIRWVPSPPGLSLLHVPRLATCWDTGCGRDRPSGLCLAGSGHVCLHIPNSEFWQPAERLRSLTVKLYSLFRNASVLCSKPPEELVSDGLLGWRAVMHVCFCPSVSEPVIFRTILCRVNNHQDILSIVLVNGINVFLCHRLSFFSPERAMIYFVVRTVSETGRHTCSFSLCFRTRPLPSVAFCSCSLFYVCVFQIWST